MTMDDIIDAALRLAQRQPWQDVSLSEIAAELGVSLADLSQHVSSKSQILEAFMRRADQRLLRSLEADPVEGEAHDRLFDVMLRRLELLAPEKAAIASIVRAPAEGFLDLLPSALTSQAWTLAAAGLSPQGMRRDVARLGLTKIHADILRVWVDDDDPGLARTMAALDRKLRDGEALMKRIETPVSLATSFVRAFRAVREKHKEDQGDESRN
ncbi:TetR family transcriptional regulator [soil metagenome]